MVFLVNVARVVYAPLVEPLRAAFGVGPGTIGLVVTLAWVGSALPRIPTGYLLTYVPRHYVVLGAGSVLALSSLFATTADSVVMLAVGALCMGLASGSYFVAANPLVSELYPDRVGRALGVHGTASQIGAVLAPAIVTVALLAGSWRFVFGAIAFAALASTVFIYRAARRTTLPAASGVDRNFGGAIRAEWRLILLGVAILATAGFVWQGVFNFYVSYLEATKAVDEGTARNLLTIVFAAGVPAFWVSGRLVDRLPTVPYLFAAIASFVVCLFALTFVRGFVALIVVTAALGYTIHSLFPAMDAFLLSSLPDANRGSAYAVYSGVMMLLVAPGSWVVGELVELGIGYDLVFQGFGFCLTGVLVVLIGLHRIDRLPGVRRSESAAF